VLACSLAPQAEHIQDCDPHGQVEWQSKIEFHVGGSLCGWREKNDICRNHLRNEKWVMSRKDIVLKNVSYSGLHIWIRRQVGGYDVMAQ
jgi:hypothetical protein